MSPRRPRGSCSTSTTLITTTDPVRIAEDYGTLQHPTDGRLDHARPRQHRPGLSVVRQGHPRRHRLAVENYALCTASGARTWVTWKGRSARPLQGFTATPRPLDGLPPFVWHGSIRSPRSRAGRLLRRRLLRQPHLLAGVAHPSDGAALPRALRALRPRPRADPGDRRLAGRLHALSQDAVRCPGPLRQRPGLWPRPVAGELHARDALTVRSPQQVIRADARLPRVCRRLPASALPPLDHAGPPLKTVLSSSTCSASRSCWLRREFAALRPARIVPDAPTHASPSRSSSFIRRVPYDAAAPSRRLRRPSGPADHAAPGRPAGAAASAALGGDGCRGSAVTIELREHAHATSTPSSPASPPARSRTRCEGHRRRQLIVVTPTFGASHGPVRRSSTLWSRMRCGNKPVLLAATGGIKRHSLMLEHALRPLFSHPRAAPGGTAVLPRPPISAVPAQKPRGPRPARGRELASAVTGASRARPKPCGSGAQEPAGSSRPNEPAGVEPAEVEAGRSR